MDNAFAIEGKVVFDFSHPADITNRRLSVKQDTLDNALLQIPMDGRETDIVMYIEKKTPKLGDLNHVFDVAAEHFILENNLRLDHQSKKAFVEGFKRGAEHYRWMLMSKLGAYRMQLIDEQEQALKDCLNKKADTYGGFADGLKRAVFILKEMFHLT